MQSMIIQLNRRALTEMSENKKFWRSQIRIIETGFLDQLENAVNEFCKDKFVVGIQYPDAFHGFRSVVAIVSYKVLDDESKE